MASFCAQCSIDLWGFDDKDYAGWSTEEDTKARRYARILCEGCGPTLADHRGFCVDPRCMRKHGVLVEECKDGDLLEAKPFDHVTEAPEIPEPVGKDWLEGLDDDMPHGEWPIDAIR